MDVLETATTEELLDALCERCLACAVSVTPIVRGSRGEPEVIFRLHGDVMQRSGLIQALATAQAQSMTDWLGQ